MISAVSGMMLEARPPLSAPTVMVANASGSTSRGMSMFRAEHTWVAMFTGSTVFCGPEEWPPLPWILIMKVAIAPEATPGE